MDRIKQEKLVALAQALIDQEKARVIVPPKENSSGFWFGGGNLALDRQGNFYLTGRYRNFGDSRFGTSKGDRGLELALFKSTDRGRMFTKIKSFGKKDLNIGAWEVLSIEGTALYFSTRGVELFLSSEKRNRPFPAELEDYQKPGTGSWTIEVMRASSVESLGTDHYATIIENRDPRWFNTKDPFVYETRDGAFVLGYCTHPFNWSSTNTGYVTRSVGARKFSTQNNSFFPRGFCWDVGITRGTAILKVPRVGRFADDKLDLFFYDGGEALREYPSHQNAVHRPRGHSCEEIGGLAYIRDGRLKSVRRLSPVLPMFTSPWWTGCSRYVDILETEEGYYATWQQSRQDKSQPLVLNFLPRKDAENILR